MSTEARSRHERAQRAARRRLQRRERAAWARLVHDGPPVSSGAAVLDSERYAAPLYQRLGPRERVQIVLWASMAVVFVCSLVSFFSTPLMDRDLAVSALLIGTMLILSYVV